MISLRTPPPPPRPLQTRAVSNHLAPILVRSVAEARARLGVACETGGVMVHGASGSGKTSLALAVAGRFRFGFWTDVTMIVAAAPFFAS